MLDLDVSSVGVSGGAAECDTTRCGRSDGAPPWGGNIDAAVESSSPRTEARVEGAPHRPKKCGGLSHRGSRSLPVIEGDEYFRSHWDLTIIIDLVETDQRFDGKIIQGSKPIEGVTRLHNVEETVGKRGGRRGRDFYLTRLLSHAAGGECHRKDQDQDW